MLYWAALSLVIATITASLGFTGIAVSAVEAAKVIFLFFLSDNLLHNGAKLIVSTVVQQQFFHQFAASHEAPSYSQV